MSYTHRKTAFNCNLRTCFQIATDSETKLENSTLVMNERAMLHVITVKTLKSHSAESSYISRGTLNNHFSIYKVKSSVGTDFLRK